MQATGKTIVGRAACDWLTLTTWEPHAAHQAAMQARFREKEEPSRAKWQQYEGYQGEQYFYGEGQQLGTKHFAIWTSGALADEVLPTTTEIDAYGDLFQGKARRVDVQLTLPDWERPKRLARLALELEENLLGAWGRKGAPPTVQCIGGPTGDTLYIGQRASPRYIRIYQKEVKGERFLRLEVEYKGDLAQNLYKEYRALGEGLFKATLLGEIRTWPKGLRGYLAPFETYLESTVAQRPFAVREAPPEWRKLEWLKRIAPSLKELVKSEEVGKEAWDIICEILDTGEG